MNNPRFEVVPPPPPEAVQPSTGTRSTGVIVISLLIVAALGGGALMADRQLEQLLSTLDEEMLAHATQALDRLLDRQRDQLAAEVTVLADDNRIRATVLAPTFDEATVLDVIEDIRKSSGATLLAVLDANGKVKAVSGMGALSEADLGASPSVKSAFSRPTSDVWTLPDQVQVIGLAPIRSGESAPALLVKGLPLGRSQLATVESTLGVAGAVFIGDKVAATSSQRPGLDEALQAAGRLTQSVQQITTSAGSYLARVSRTGQAATAARVAWLIPYHHHGERTRLLRLLIWCPVALGALLFLLLIVNARRTNGGPS